MNIRSLRFEAKCNKSVLVLKTYDEEAARENSKKVLSFSFRNYPDGSKSWCFERPAMTISLSKAPIKALVVSKPGYLTIGFVRWGLEYGWLSITPDGDYVRVNGSIEERLNYRDVKTAMYRASKNRKGVYNGFM